MPGHPFPLVDGHGDPALAPEGEAQAERLADRLASHHIDAIYVTSLRRTVQTAAPLAARLGLEPIVERDLREVHLGDWEGELYRQRVAEGHPIAMQMITEERWDVIPGAESADSLRERVGGALRRIVAAHAGQRVVVVAHGGVIAEIMAQVADTRGRSPSSAATTPRSPTSCRSATAGSCAASTTPATSTATSTAAGPRPEPMPET